MYGIGRYPVARHQMIRPKIGIYTATATMPSTPLNLVVGDPNHNGMCNTAANTSSQVPYCTALFTLTQKDKLPESMVSLVTSTDVANNALVDQRYTALINTTGAAIPVPASGPAPLLTFVNGGGIYIGGGSGTQAITSARSAQITNLNTQSISGLSTPGSTFDGAFDTTNPVAWGFDNGGWIYRDGTGNATFTTASLTGSGTIPDAKAAVTYAGDATHALRSYGYQVNGNGPTGLNGRPAVVDQPYGAGHAIMMGFDPFFRAWKEQDEREVLNAILYPLTPELDPTDEPAAPEQVPTLASLERRLEEQAIPGAKLPAAKSRPVTATSRADRDVRIEVPRAYMARLKLAVRLSQLPRRVAGRASYLKHRDSAVLLIKGVRTSNQHAREPWTRRVMAVLKARKIPVISAQL